MSFTCKVPKLRFSEFSGEWVEKKLGDISFQISYGLTIRPDYIETGIPLISARELRGGIVNYKDAPKISQKSYDELSGKAKANKGDIFLTKTGTIGLSAYVDTDSQIAITQNIAVIRVDSAKYSHEFILQTFKTEKFQKLALSKVNQSTIMDLQLQDIRKLYIFLSSKPEQEKIASFLTVVDAKIEQLTCKEKLLEKYKKSAMQKLFSQELRFTCNDGSEYSEWEEKKLGEVAEIIMGQSPDSSSYNSDEIGVPLIQGNADIQNRLSNPRNWTTQVTKECKIGDLILTVRAPVGAIAKSMHNACIGRGVCAIRNNAKSNIEFLFQFLLNFESKWGSLEQGSTFTAVSGNEIKNLKINLPSLPEQTKIANFLSAIDEKCLHVKHQLEQTKQFKKALLQQMFV